MSEDEVREVIADLIRKLYREAVARARREMSRLQNMKRGDIETT